MKKIDKKVLCTITLSINYENDTTHEKKWIGECHSTVAILYMCLSELGYKCKLCPREVTTNFPTNMVFDHGWIEVNNKIIDLACYRTLMG